MFAWTSATIRVMKALAAKIATRTPSRAMTVIAIGSAEETGTQTGSDCVLLNPTKTMPATNRATTSSWVISWAADDLPAVFMAHNRYCSTANLPSWSKRVEKMMLTWQGIVDVVVSITVEINATWAHRAADKRNVMRTSLRPSLNMAEPFPLMWRNSAADAALTTMPLHKRKRKSLARPYSQHPLLPSPLSL